MLDRRTRAAVAPPLTWLADRAHSLGLRPFGVTVIGLLVGLGACVAAALGAWWVALVAWLINRTLDGLDGALARRHGGASDLGGFLDFLADFVVYGGFVLAVAIARPEARVACAFLLVAYLLNNVALLSFASLIEKRELDLGDERSLRFTSGLIEGTETIVAYVAICLLPGYAAVIAWGFGAAVLFTVGQRVALARRWL